MLSSGGGLQILVGLSGLLMGAPEVSAPSDSAASASTPEGAVAEDVTKEGAAAPADASASTHPGQEGIAEPSSEPPTLENGSGDAELPTTEEDPTPFPDSESYEDPIPVRRDSIFDAGYGTRGQVTVAVGGLYDALDPRAAAGASLRVPQFTTDARFGLGKGWSVTAHLNTILAINELDAGLSFAFPLIGEIRGVAQFQAGAHLGMLGSFGFESLIVAPEFRPLLGLSVPIASMRWSLRGELVFAGPYVASLGGVTETLSTPPPLANWNIALVLEHLLKNERLWYAGVLMMGSTAIYQNWLLFPDTSHYDFYPRVVGGYEF